MFTQLTLTDVYNEDLVENDNYFMIPALRVLDLTDYIPAGKDDINRYLHSYFYDAGHSETFSEAVEELRDVFPEVELVTYTNGQIQQLDFNFLEE